MLPRLNRSEENYGLHSPPFRERNYPCDGFIYGVFGVVDLNQTGTEAFQRQLYLCMFAQALRMKAQIESWKSKNIWGLLLWQYNEIWPTGGWGSIEYGTPVPGQVLGGRWKPLKRPRASGRPNKGGPLYDSGNLREQASNVSVIGSGLHVFVTAPGAALHMYGRKNTSQDRGDRGRFKGAGGFPARPYLPKAPALPTPWQRGINTAATNVLGVVLRTK